MERTFSPSILSSQLFRKRIFFCEKRGIASIQMEIMFGHFREKRKKKYERGWKKKR